MEDIKILETVVNCRKFDGIYTTNEVIFEAIENLINRNKELEKQVDLEYVEENYIEKSKVIPKSKVKEKIEELKKELQEYEESDMEQDEDYFFDVNALKGEIQVLQELLEK